MAKSIGPRRGASASPPPAYKGEWQKVPRWHPARWFGYDLRRWVAYRDDGDWEYDKSRIVAREALRQQFEVQAPTQQEGNPFLSERARRERARVRSPNWIA